MLASFSAFFPFFPLGAFVLAFFKAAATERKLLVGGTSSSSSDVVAESESSESCRSGLKFRVVPGVRLDPPPAPVEEYSSSVNKMLIKASTFLSSSVNRRLIFDIPGVLHNFFCYFGIQTRFLNITCWNVFFEKTSCCSLVNV